jgi:hypothetical protein
MPKELLGILIIELKLGNEMVGIGIGKWPNQESIVVNLRNRFSEQSKVYSIKTIWRSLNDRHYCSEEIAQKENGIEHLLIA